MPSRVLDLRGTPLLDVASYGRRGPGHLPLSKAEIQHISRTVRRVPEVVIKVSGGARTLRGVRSHFDYIGREGEGEIETDDGRRLQRMGFEMDLVRDWDLDLDVDRRHTERGIGAGRRAPKLVHNLVFSMPEGTPSEALLQAVRVFAREKFALQHRYAMTLHTDQGHPHVHVVVRAVSERGQRLNIRPTTLRQWRRDFAQCLREQGVEANATERAVRGTNRQQRKDGIYRAAERGESTFLRDKVAAVARELIRGEFWSERGKLRLLETRRAIERGWLAVGEVLARDGMHGLAAEVRRFVEQMPPTRTDRESMAQELDTHGRGGPVLSR